MFKRTCSLLLALVMVIGLMPMPAHADEVTDESPALVESVAETTGASDVVIPDEDPTAEEEEQEPVAPAAEFAASVEADVLNEDAAETKVAYIGETGYATLADAVAAANGDTTINLVDGTHTMPNSVSNKSITITGSKNAVVEMLNAVGATGSTVNFSGVTVKFDNDGYEGLQHSAKVTYTDCTHIGTQFLYAPEVTFTGCTFEMYDEKTEYSVWTYGASDVTFTNCTFNTNGKAVLVYIEGAHKADIKVDDCKFTSTGKFTDKAAVEVGASANGAVSTYNLTFTGCTVDEKFAANNSTSALWGNKDSIPGERLTVTIDGKQVYPAASTEPETPSVSVGGTTYDKIEDAVEAAKTANKPVELPTTSSNSTTIPTAVTGVAVTVPVANGTVTFDKDSDVDGATLSMTAVESTNEYEITLTKDGEAVTGFSATVTMPAVAADKVKVYYLGENGVKTFLDGEFNVVDGTVTFTTTHFSTWGTEAVAETADPTKWDGTTDTTWYNAEAAEFTITTAAELAGLAKLVNEGTTFSGKTVKLGADIDLDNKAWTPIGNNGTPFAGNFDGGNHTISNLHINESEKSYQGLFGQVKNSAEPHLTFANVTLTNVNVTGKSYVAGLIADAFRVDITNCHVNGDIFILNAGNNNYTGAIVGHAYANIRNCSAKDTGTDGKGKIQGCYSGGIAGWTGEANGFGGYMIENCTVENIDFVEEAGTIVGLFNAGVVIKNCAAKNCTINANTGSGTGYTGLIAGDNRATDGAPNGVLNSSVENVTGTVTVGGETQQLTQVIPIKDTSVVGTDVVLDNNNKIVSGNFSALSDAVAAKILSSDSEMTKNDDGSYSVAAKPAGVAKIGDNVYATLQAAIDAANANDTITLLGDTQADMVTVKAGKNVTIDFGGKTLNGSMMVEKGATADIKNGKIYQTASVAGIEVQGVATLTEMNITSEGRHAIRVDGLNTEGTKLIVNSGTYTTTAPLSGSYYAVNAGEKSVVEIRGGKFVGNGGSQGAFIVKSEDTLVTIQNGEFYNGDAIIMQVCNSTVITGGTYGGTGGVRPAEGYMLVQDGNVYKVVKATVKNETTGKMYGTIQSAIDAAQAKETVKLLDNTAESNIQVADDDDIVIDLNGKTLTGYIFSKGVLTVKNGTITNEATESGIESNGTAANLTLEDLTVTTNKHALRIDGGKATIVSGTYTSKGAGTMHCVNIGSADHTSTEVTIQGGTFYGSDVATSNGGCICLQSGSKVTITGGKFYSSDGASNKAVFATWGGHVNIQGGEFYAAEGAVILDTQGSATSEITGGWYNKDPEQFIKRGLAVKYDEEKKLYGIVSAVAEIGEKGYATLQAAIDAAKANETVTLLADMELSETIKVASGKTVTLDLNGKIITGTDTKTSGNYDVIYNEGTLTVKDSSEAKTGKITLTATTNRGWNAYSAVISNMWGTLNVESGTLEHLGGTAMAYAIDNRSNTNAQDAVLNVSGGTVKSAYIAIRQYANSSTGSTTANITGGTIEGTNTGIWIQSPNANANVAALTVSGGEVKGRILVYSTSKTTVALNGGTIESFQVSVSEGTIEDATITKADTVTLAAPEGYEWNENGTLVTQAVAVAKIGDTEYISLADAFAAANAGETITLLDDIDLSGWTSVDVGKAITLDGSSKTITGLTAPLVNNASANFTVKNLTISDANIEVKSANGADNDTSAAALVQWANGGTLTLNNVSVTDSTIKGDGYVAALVGFVDSTAAGVVVNGGTLSGNTLTAGGVVGTVAALTYADVTVNNPTVSDNDLKSTSDNGTRPDKVGLVVGRPVADTVSVSATVSGDNSAEPLGENGVAVVIGSLSGGNAVITGGSYPVDPTVTAKADQSVSVKEGFEVKENEDGTFGVQEIPYTEPKVATIEGQEKMTLSAAFAYAKEHNGTVITLDEKAEIDLSKWTSVNMDNVSFTLDGNGATITGLPCALIDSITTGGKTVVIKDLTISGAVNAGLNSTHSGVVNAGGLVNVVGYVNLTLSNIFVEESTIGGNSTYYAGGLIGYVGATETSVLNIKDCGVTASSITSTSSSGGLFGHSNGGLTTVTDTLVADNTIKGEKEAKEGSLIGTLTGSAGTRIAVTETVQSTGTGTLNLIGRVYTGVTYTDGEYFTNPNTASATNENTNITIDGLLKTEVVEAYNKYIIVHPKVGTGFVTNDETKLTVWGQTTDADPEKSLTIELYDVNSETETKMATVVLNDIAGIIGEATSDLTWHFDVLGECTDKYWTTTWENGYPSATAQPDKVVMYIDGVKVDEDEVQMNRPDGLIPVQWSEQFVAKIEGKDTFYPSLQTAINAAESGETVTLLANTTVNAVDGKPETHAWVKEGKNVVIDLNNKTVTGAFFIHGTATIKNGTIVNESMVSGIETQGTLTLQNMTVTSDRHAVRVSGGTTTIVSGTYQTKGTSGTRHTINASGAETVLNIQGGTFIGAGVADLGGKGNCVMDQGCKSVAITGGNFYGANGVEGPVCAATNTVISGGKFADVTETWRYTATTAEGYVGVKIEENPYNYEVIKLTNWIQVADTSWYEEGKTAFTITTAEQLAGVAKLVNAGTTFSGVTITLGADIDMSGTAYGFGTEEKGNLPWPGIGVYKDVNKAFQGIFNGNSKKISGVTFADASNSDANSEANNYRGFFNYVNNATVQNLTIRGNVWATAPASSEYGGAMIVGHAKNSTISGCVAEGTINGTHNVAGIVVRVQDATIQNCTNKAAITGSYSKMGGIAALVQNSETAVLFEGCVNEGTITSTARGEDGVGGIVGWIGYPNTANITVKNCQNKGVISATDAATVGQIAAESWNGNHVFVGNKGLATMVATGHAAMTGLNFATVADGVATYVNAIEAGKTYLVTAPEAKPTIKLNPGQSISFDTSLATIDASGITADTEIITETKENATTYTVAVAKIGTAPYATIQDAINAANADSTITVIADTTITAENAKAAIGKNVSITKAADLEVAAPEGYEWKDNTTLVEKAEEAKITITDNGRTLSLDGEIYINQYVGIEGIADTAYIAANGGLLIWNSEVTEADAIYGKQDIIKEGLLTNGTYEGKPEFGQRTDGIAAKMYADELYLRVYVKLEDGTYVYGPLVEYSVQDYCEGRLENSDNQKLKDTCAALLHYGASAQSYQNYNTSDPANANILESWPEYDWNADMLTALVSANTELTGTNDVKDNGKTLSLDGEIKINYYFAPTTSDWSIASGELQVWYGVNGALTEDNISYTTVMVHSNGSEWGAQSKGIPADEYGNTVYARAKLIDEQGDVHYSNVIAYSAEEYAAGRIANSSNTKLVDLMKKMVIYGDYAKTYLA